MPDSSDNVNARDGASIEWGPEIRVDGKRPAWLTNQDRFSWYGCTYRGTSHDWQGVERIRLPADHPHYSKAPTTPELDPALWDRMVAFVTAVAEATNATPFMRYSDIQGQARAIVADLPKPVEPDLIEARKLAASFSDREDVTHADYLSGDLDSGDEVQNLLAAIKRGRELAAPEVSHVG